MLTEHFRAALDRLDVGLARKIWAQEMPHLPQLQDDAEALIALHIARTAAQSIRFKSRAYSHAWLIERGLPSNLPDALRPRAERLYPQQIPAVGIAVRNTTPAAMAIRRAMEEAVLDAGTSNSSLTKRAILAARAKTRRLLGIE